MADSVDGSAGVTSAFAGPAEAAGGIGVEEEAAIGRERRGPRGAPAVTLLDPTGPAA